MGKGKREEWGGRKRKKLSEPACGCFFSPDEHATGRGPFTFGLREDCRDRTMSLCLLSLCLVSLSLSLICFFYWSTVSGTGTR